MRKGSTRALVGMGNFARAVAAPLVLVGLMLSGDRLGFVLLGAWFGLAGPGPVRLYRSSSTRTPGSANSRHCGHGRRPRPGETRPDYTLEGKRGLIRLVDVFGGKSQLIVCNHMWFPGER